MKFSGDPVIEARPDREEKITVVDGHIRGIGSVHAQVPHKEGMIGGDSAPPHDVVTTGTRVFSTTF